MTQPSQVIERLTAMRRTIRRRLIAYGACVVAMGGVASFLTIVTLDWLLWLPAPIRVVGALMFLGGFVWALWHWVIRAVRAQLGLSAVAARLEQHFESFDDRLVSAVNFLESGDAGSKSMMRQVIANTERMLTHMPLESALSLKPLTRRVALVTITLTVLLVTFATSHDWVQTGFYRYVYPWGELQWPRTVSIQPMTGDRVVAIGESVTVRMTVARGLSETLRGVVHVRENNGGTTQLAMERNEDGEFQATIDTVTRDLTYWFAAGDDETRRTPFAIRTVRRPEVAEALAEITPPAYATQRAPRVEDLTEGPVHAPAGGQVRVTIRTSKPVAGSTESGANGLRTVDGKLIPLTATEGAKGELTASLTVSGDTRFRIELHDEHGFENRGARPHAILAVPDARPTVTVVEPPATVELTPRASLELLVRVEDDFGVSTLALESEVVGREAPDVTSLTEALELSDNGHGVESVASYRWSMDSLDLRPGDVVSYSAVATDNFTGESGSGQVGRSPTIHIKIISEAEFDTRVRSDITMLEARIRETALAQTDLLDRTANLIRPGDLPEALTGAERDLAATLAADQGRLIRRLGELGSRFRRLVERMERNGAGDTETRQRLESMIESLRQIAGSSMGAAGAALGEARAAPDAVTQQQRIAAAVEAEEDSVDRLQSMLHAMAQWGSFRELVTKTRDLLDRQHQLRRDTVSLGKATLGKAVESLGEDEAARLRQIARRQEQLGGDVERLLDRMRRLAAERDGAESTGAEAMEDALRVARALDLTEQLRTALEGITDNRTAAATIAQQAAAEAMHKMESALKERENRQLEALRKQLEEAQEQVAFLVEHQEAVRTDTGEAKEADGEDDVWRTLYREQHTIRRNARSVAEELTDVPDSAPAARLVRQSTRPMGDSERHLRDAAGTPAQVAQNDALALLEEALEELDDAANETAEELFRRTLAQIREMLEAVLAAQQEINGGVDDVVAAVESEGTIGRRQARSASLLARKQADVRASLDAEIETFEKVVVYQWALERISGWMVDSRTRLGARQLDTELVRITHRIARELEKLIDAIKETESLPVDTQFVETEQGGGGGGGPQGEQKPVPTVAELLVLRAMQADINERTGALHEAIDLADASEVQLQRLKTVAEDQKEVRRLTDLVTRRAAHP